MGRALTTPVPVGELASRLGLAVVGDPAYLLSRVDAAADALNGSLCFAKTPAWAAAVSPAAVVISLGEAPAFQVRQAPLLLSKNPRLDFIRALYELEQAPRFVWSSVNPYIHASARVGRNVVLGPGVRIGADTVISDNVFIGAEVVVGERCSIGPNTVIGHEGFGYERDETARALRFPHIGSVVIGDDVSVGALTTICRGTLANTVLHSGCKIDDHVHIAHNVEIGADAFVIACAEVSGGVKVGARAWIAPGASIMNQAVVGADAVIGLGAVVLRSVPDGEVVVGNPAKPRR